MKDNLDWIQEELDKRTPPGWYGLATGRGWWPIIWEAHKQIVSLFPDYNVYQIKEKFGGLRYYCSNDGDERLRRIIAAAELLCSLTCEVCGESGVRRNDLGWISTLCDEHYLARKTGKKA